MDEHGSNQAGCNAFRCYEPATGRYTRADPLGLAGGLMLYAYASSNPVVYLDPLGRQTQLPPPGPEFGPGPWGGRPDEGCCDESEVRKRRKRLREMLNQFWEAIPGRPAGPGLNESFNPTISPEITDPCVLFCTRVHEYWHWTDTRRRNVYWGDNFTFRFQEEPAHEQELKCLQTFSH